ncbi:hypothetical protein JHK86_022481 [Glycine max]|nr:hypothetical protein JHK86_022481 [Glycine max]
MDTIKRAGIEIFGEGMIETFHNDDEALATVDNGVTICEGQKDIAASGFVPCNSDSKDCLDIEVMENLNLGDLVGKPYGTQV